MIYYIYETSQENFRIGKVIVKLNKRVAFLTLFYQKKKIFFCEFVSEKPLDNIDILMDNDTIDSVTPTKGATAVIDEFEEPYSPGRFVKRIKGSSEEEMATTSDADDENLDDKEVRIRYRELLARMKKERRRKTGKLSRRKTSTKNLLKSLAEKTRGWQMMELQKHEDHKEQYHAWIAFKSSVEANLQMYGIERDEDKLICLQTKCKGFLGEIINSIQRQQVKPSFKEVWSGLQVRFYAPIDVGEETSVFYQMKQLASENIFNYFERVAKQAYLCDFSKNECAKRIGETFARNCLNPSFFLGIFNNFEDLDQIKQHAKNFHGALPKINPIPVLAMNSQQTFSRNTSSELKRKFPIHNVDEIQKRRRFEQRKPENYYHYCNYCGESNCNRRNCPARGKRCNYCQRLDHLERACFKKKSDMTDNKNIANVNAVAEEEDVKKLQAGIKDEREVLFKIGNSLVTKFLVDSGCVTNVMSEATFKTILDSAPDSIYKLCFSPTVKLSAYGGHPLEVKCTFSAWTEVIGVDKPKKFAEFIVIRGCAQDLMGYKADRLNVQ